jgi:hydroxymethylpyrimidine/phosphomethylpyrimidine kinase
MTKLILSIAGSDPSGGAGIQVDIKTIHACGGYALTAITSLTVQNTLGVKKVDPVSADFLKAQLKSLSDDFTIHAVKIGMLGSAENARIVARWLKRQSIRYVVWDPVLKATSGACLYPLAQMTELKNLIPLCSVMTPNQAELEYLVPSKMNEQKRAEVLLKRGALGVVVTGGSGQTKCIDTLYFQKNQQTKFVSQESRRIRSRNQHGTGCVFSTALACFLAEEMNLEKAFQRAKEFTFKALQAAARKKWGQGSGSLDPFFGMKATWKSERETMILKPSLLEREGRVGSFEPERVSRVKLESSNPSFSSLHLKGRDLVKESNLKNENPNP